MCVCVLTYSTVNLPPHDAALLHVNLQLDFFFFLNHVFALFSTILIKLVESVMTIAGLPPSQSTTSPINNPLLSRGREEASSLSSLFISSSFPSTQPTVPALSEASSRHINVIFPLVFLTAVLNSYETLKAAAHGSLSQGYLRESLEGPSLPPRKKKKNLVFPFFVLRLSIPPHPRPGPSPPAL